MACYNAGKYVNTPLAGYSGRLSLPGATNANQLLHEGDFHSMHLTSANQEGTRTDLIQGPMGHIDDNGGRAAKQEMALDGAGWSRMEEKHIIQRQAP